MDLSQKFLPQEALVNEQSFYSRNNTEIDAIETDLYTYMQSLQAYLVGSGFLLSDQEFRSIQTATALIDALTKVRPEQFERELAESHHHAFNVFYKPKDSNDWKLQFANATYLNNVGAGLSQKIQSSEFDLMQHLYLPETIERFNIAANNPQGGYTAQYVEMDKVVVDEKNKEDKPAFFWYRKEFNHPDGGKIQIRIGMNGTGFVPEQKREIMGLYTVADALRTKWLNYAHYSNPSYEAFIARIKADVISIIKGDAEKDDTLLMSLAWLQMILEIADDIVKNSPFPLVIVDGKGAIEHISPAYATMVGYTVNDILNEGFFDKIYPPKSIERTVVNDNLAIYAKEGRYNEWDTFIASRWVRFAKLETFLKIPPVKSLELVPLPYAFENGTIRLNSARPLDHIPWLEDMPSTTGLEFQLESDEDRVSAVSEDAKLSEYFKNQGLDK